MESGNIIYYRITSRTCQKYMNTRCVEDAGAREHQKLCRPIRNTHIRKKIFFAYIYYIYIRNFFGTAYTGSAIFWIYIIDLTAAGPVTVAGRPSEIPPTYCSELPQSDRQSPRKAGAGGGKD